MVNSDNSHVLDLSIVRPTATEPEVHVGIQSSFLAVAGLGRLRPDLSNLVANISFRPLDATPAAIAPPNRVSTDLTFDLSLVNPGALSFPIVLDFTRPTAIPFYRKGRAMYLSMEGRWLRASNYSCERFPTLLPFLSADVVTNERTILKTFICHNTEFAVFQQPESAGCSSFVRACNLCVPERTGCGCTGAPTWRGFASDATSIGLALLISAAAAALVWIEAWLGRNRKEEYERLEGSVSVDEIVHFVGAIAAVVFAAATGAHAHVAAGYPHLPDIGHNAYAWTLTGVAIARALAYTLHRFALGQWVATAAEVTAVLWWAAPSATVVEWGRDPDASTDATGTFALAWVLAIGLLFERLVARGGWPPWAKGLVGFVMAPLRFLLWWRMSCE